MSYPTPPDTFEECHAKEHQDPSWQFRDHDIGFQWVIRCEGHVAIIKAAARRYDTVKGKSTGPATDKEKLPFGRRL